MGPNHRSTEPTNGITRVYPKACLECRRKKVKCDRVLPCSQCLKSRRGDSCQYATDTTTGSGSGGAEKLPYVFLAKNPQFRFNSAPKRPKVEKERVLASPPPPPPQPGVIPLPITAPPRATAASSAALSNGLPLQLSPLSTLSSTGHMTVSVEEFLKLKERLNNIELSMNPSPQLPPSSLGFLSTVRNPYQDPDETINFYEGYIPLFFKGKGRGISLGPLSWLLTIQKDPMLSILWEWLKSGFSGKDPCYATVAEFKGGPDKTQPDGSGSEAFKRKNEAMEAEASNDTLPYDPTKPEKSRRMQKGATFEHSLQLGLTYGEYDQEATLLLNIQRVLPSRKVIWLLVNRFFRKVYPFMPLLDEADFCESIAVIIGGDSSANEPVATLTVTRRIDFALLGTLLVVLRMAYLLLFYNNPQLNEENLNLDDPLPERQEHKFLMHNPINIELFDLAKQCLDQFHIMRQYSFAMLQLAVMIRIYLQYAPEEGVICDCEGHILSSAILQMAYSIGINRDPDNFPDRTNERENNLYRKMWHMISMWDMMQACTEGQVMFIDPIYTDVKVPFYVPGNENIRYSDVDHLVTDTFSKCHRPAPVARKILRIILEVKGQTKMLELCPLLDTLELIVQGDNLSLLEIINRQSESILENYDRVLLLKVYLFWKQFLTLINIYFFLHYEKRQDVDLCFFYLKKILLLYITELLPHYYELLQNLSNDLDLMLNPVLQNTIAFLVQFGVAILIRVNFKIWCMRQLLDHAMKLKLDSGYLAYFNALCRLLLCITRAAEVLIGAMSKLAYRYYFSWRVCKAHTYMLRSITTNEFYQRYACMGQERMVPTFTLRYAEELIAMYETGLQKLGQKYTFSPEVPEYMFTEEERNLNEYPKFSLPVLMASPSVSTQVPMSVLVDNNDEMERPVQDLNDVDAWWYKLLNQRKHPEDSSLPQAIQEDFPMFDLFADMPFDLMNQV